MVLVTVRSNILGRSLQHCHCHFFGYQLPLTVNFVSVTVSYFSYGCCCAQVLTMVYVVCQLAKVTRIEMLIRKLRSDRWVLPILLGVHGVTS
jgi:hypothetical protein